MKITALVENTTHRHDLKAEHGLSLYIETLTHRILFDMGQSHLFLENAQTLGIDLSLVDLAILSHGHYDHGGGLQAFLECNRHAPVYVHKDAFAPHYNGSSKYIGLDSSLASNPRLIFTQDQHQISSNMCLFSCNHRPTIDTPPPSGLMRKVGNEWVWDDFRHEQYLLIQEEGTQVLISGCSHKGILNIAHWFSPNVIIGGFHFSKLPLDDRLEAYARQLDLFDTDFYTCHCTGSGQYEFMKKHMDRLSYLSTGETIIL